jgi:hypothetical protein
MDFDTKLKAFEEENENIRKLNEQIANEFAKLKKEN